MAGVVDDDQNNERGTANTQKGNYWGNSEDSLKRPGQACN